jgi:hypothetical protein
MPDNGVKYTERLQYIITCRSRKDQMEFVKRQNYNNLKIFIGFISLHKIE